MFVRIFKNLRPAFLVGKREAVKGYSISKMLSDVRISEICRLEDELMFPVSNVETSNNYVSVVVFAEWNVLDEQWQSCMPRIEWYSATLVVEVPYPDDKMPPNESNVDPY